MKKLRTALLLLALSPVAAAAAPCAGFTDVDSASPFCPNVAWMKARSITFGCSLSGLYCPADPVSRLAMAAFMNRLGDVVLPPNVIWVAPVGGQFQLIQPAIDYAATFATAATPVTVKVAPGTFTDPLNLKPFVNVEGSGIGATRVQATACTSDSAVLMAKTMRLSGLTIATTACTNGLLLPAPGPYADASISDIAIEMNISTGPAYGISITNGVAGDVTIRRSRLDIKGKLTVDAGWDSYAIASYNTGKLSIEDSTITLAGGQYSAGIGFSGGALDVARSTVKASSPGAAFAIATYQGFQQVRDSILDAAYPFGTAGGINTLVTNTGFLNLIAVLDDPGRVCLNTYNVQTRAVLPC